MQSSDINRRLVLASRPEGSPTTDNFRLEHAPVAKPEAGEVLLRTVYLSLDPYMRGRMSDAKSYAEPVALGDTMVGGTVSRVVESQLEGFEEGDWVLSYSGWQDYAISDGTGLINLGKHPDYPSFSLGVLGMPGITAYFGLLEIGEPKEGETLVVAAATGPVGATVGQIGKLQGCRVIGVAGGEEKCRYAVEELGFDLCLDHRAEDFAEQLAAACPEGIDIYFESVGGKVFDSVQPLLNDFARIPVCGLISQYNATSLPQGPDRTSLLMRDVLTKRLKIQGFIIFDYYERFHEAVRTLSQWVAEGSVKYLEDMVEGLEETPSAFIGLLEGQNFGKLVVRVGNDD
ncbi:NADP-dependent oxidoreductase [Microbulbifer sp. A4B17]|uniref:NADP-dependent oxidoreductase n=1 Tax=Microbulbifer sp. A4B17 TaxID=359370 RepID=UPI000D52C56F|nr:NADP-dependent oxidoreductase [Microbulbifer sp. A4B17]AWF81081.1 NADP-dependent oxidoreductase [Microbulbifer sp. A4B17]